MSKKLTNPASSGNAGAYFEACVQASFVTLMLSGGNAPCLPCWPIKEIKLQGKIHGFQTDDLIVIVENSSTSEQRKLLGQVKRSVEITTSCEQFAEFIQAAWEDFNNDKIFTRGKDVIALITGPLSATYQRIVQYLLLHARNTVDVDEFFLHIETAKYSPSGCAKKLKIIKYHLQKANGGNEVSEGELYCFLKHFYWLGYDLEYEHGVVRSLLHSHISQFQHDSPQQLWSSIVEFVQPKNASGGTITRDNVPKEILEAFEQKHIVKIPKRFEPVREAPTTDWARHQDASYLALAVLLGSWNDKNPNDTKAVAEFLDIRYEEWHKKAREILPCPDSPLSLCEGIWKVKNRAELWRLLGARILDQNINAFENLAERILTAPDPICKLPINQRFLANVHGYVPEFSSNLRKGIAEGLAMMGSMPKACCNCSTGKISGTCSAVLYRMLNNADWSLWGSLNSILPNLAESAPEEFLKAVEKALSLSPCPFEELFAQEGKGIHGNNYMCGLLWALECLAWDEKYLVRVSSIFGELAKLDPGGRWSNRPDHSLVTIFLPWYPQTMASIEKRKTAVRTLLQECPNIAWKLLLQLLPGQIRTSSGSYKPFWRKIIPENWENKVTHKDYFEQVSFYCGLAVDVARDNEKRIAELIDHFDNFPNPAFDQLVELLDSESILALPEEKRLLIWEQLTKFTNNLRRYPEDKKDWPADLRKRIEQITQKLSPANPLHLYKPLFSNRDFELYEKNGDWKEQGKKLEERREKGLAEIIHQYGVEGIRKFAALVDSPEHVGRCLRLIANDEFEQTVFPKLLNTSDSKFKSMLSAFIFCRHTMAKSWEWSDHIIKPEWTREQIAPFLLSLPFCQGTWDRVSKWLDGEQDKYWSKANVAPYQEEDHLSFAIEKLIEYGRPHDAIRCLHTLLHEKKPIDTNQCIKALLEGLSSSEQSGAIDQYNLTQLIEFLQNEPTVDQEKLITVEWGYLRILDNKKDNIGPKTLENMLASDAEAFCTFIRKCYRSKKEEQESSELSHQDRMFAENAWCLLHGWKTPPGTQKDGTFSEDHFNEWLQKVKRLCTESGHLEVALGSIGQVLTHAPADPDGLWIHRAVAAALNDSSAEEMRKGFRQGIINSRGLYWVDPSGKPEKELAEQYRKKADEIENAGYYRFAVTLKDLSDYYSKEAERVIAEHKSEDK